MAARRGDYRRHKRWVPVAERRLRCVIDESHRRGIAQNLGVFIEDLMRSATNRGKDSRLAKSMKTHFRNPRIRKPSWRWRHPVAQGVAVITALTSRAFVVKASIFRSQIRSFSKSQSSSA
jgi:hypothetical protein